MRGLLATRWAVVTALLMLPVLGVRAEDRTPGTAVIPLPYAFYTPETSLSAGVILMVVDAPGDPAQRENVLRSGGYLSLNGQAEVFASLELYTPGNGVRLNVDGYAARFPNKFFGIGPDAGSEEDYVPFEGMLDTTAGFRLAPDLYLGPRLRLFGSRMQDRASDGVLIQDTVPGADGTGLIAPGFRLAWDTRDSSVAPTRGFFIDFSGTWSLVTFGGSSFPSATLDARLFHSPFVSPFTSRKVVLAAQLCSAWAGREPPFQELPRLGGDELMRGYYDGRYRDNALVAAQAEIRIPVWWRFGLAVFGAAGMVAPDPLAFSPQKAKVAGGAGLRFVLDEGSGASLRADVAVSQDGADFYFNLGEAF